MDAGVSVADESDEYVLQPEELDFSVLTDENRLSVVRRSGEYELPPGLKRGVFDAGDGLKLHYYHTTEVDINNGAVAAIGYSGFKSDLILDPQEINLLSKRNVPFIWLALHNPVRDLDFMDANKMACRKFLTNPPPEAKEIIESRIPIALTGHSTGAQIALEQANEPNHYQFLKERFCGVAVQSPMLETSPLFYWFSHKLQSRILDGVISRYGGLLPEEFALGRLYLRLCRKPSQIDKDRPYIRPTLPQIKEIRDNARAYLIDKQGPHILAKGDLPVAFFLGVRDTSADPTTTIGFAKSIGAGVFLDPNAEHAPICENRRNMVKYVKTLNEMANQTFKPSAHQPPQKLRSFFSDKAKKRFTGRLNSAARTLQCLL